ncbi:tripartite tricarboxylate transporter substrate binding protein [Pacificibacter sp.]|uniref:Bug family tripartite tricarboxylate transporter substrate binding protein n=1 Tax=Pacificibacter sp. TaxID=1917866 RepID=UPI00321BF7F9
MKILKNALLGAGLLISTFAGAAVAWEPEKPIKIYVGFSPGGGTDIVARSIVASAQEFFPVPLVVVNRPGAGGVLAAEFVKNQKADGYSLLVAGGSESTSVPNHRKVNYDIVEDFDGVIRLIRSRLFICAPTDSEFSTVAELKSVAEANPGKITYGSSGQGSITHSAVLVLEKALGVEFQHVPYKGGAPAIAAMLGGHVDFTVCGPEDAQAQVAAGNIQLIATSSESRYPGFPDVPNYKELGYDVSVDNQKGLIAPAGTPEEVLQYLHDHFKMGLDSIVWEKMAGKLKLETSYLSGPDFESNMVEMSAHIGRAVNGE